MRILLIDDRPVAQIGLFAIFTAEPDLEVVGTEPKIESALDALAVLQPDVVVVETETANDGTFDAIRAVRGRRPDSAILLITDDRSADTALQALDAGTSGYLSSRSAAELMVQAVRTIGADGVVLTRSAAAGVAARRAAVNESLTDGLGKLSERERRVLGLLAQGRSNSEIALHLFISEATVKKHLSQALRKLGLRDRLQAGLYAYRLGLGEMVWPQDGAGGPSMSA